MQWIPWENALTTGHAVLDADHKPLVDLFNQLAASVIQRKDKAVCVDLLDDIIQHAKTHFDFEEQLMAEHGYSKAESHAAEHARLVRQAAKFMVKFEEGSPGSHIDVIHFPEDWLTFHILGADKELAGFLSESA
jgi:hemerythrin-like metal-binding protein